MRALAACKALANSFYISTFESFVETVPEPRTIVRVEGASHFDVRRPLAAALAEWGGAILDK